LTALPPLELFSLEREGHPVAGWPFRLWVWRLGFDRRIGSTFVDDLTIKEILRHSDVSVIKRIDEKSVEAMDKFEAELRKPVQSVKGKARKADTVVPVGMA